MTQLVSVLSTNLVHLVSFRDFLRLLSSLLSNVPLEFLNDPFFLNELEFPLKFKSKTMIRKNI